MSLTYGFCLGAEDTLYTSQQFSEAFHALVGDGICPNGTEFALTLDGGFRLTVGTGFALIHGRWMENDAPFSLTLPPSGNNADRYDAVAAKIDYTAKRGTLTVLVGIDPAALRKNPAIIRNDQEYSIILYLLHVRRGATSVIANDVEDVRADAGLCGKITPVRSIALDVLKIYDFLTSGIDAEVSRILGLAEAEIEKGQAAVNRLDAAIRNRKGVEIGDVVKSLSNPKPEEEWLLCSGGRVPAEYTELREMLGGFLPDIRHEDERFHSFIYGGPPGETETPEEPTYFPYVPDGSSAYMTADGKIYCCKR